MPVIDDAHPHHHPAIIFLHHLRAGRIQADLDESFSLELCSVEDRYDSYSGNQITHSAWTLTTHAPHAPSRHDRVVPQVSVDRARSYADYAPFRGSMSMVADFMERLRPRMDEHRPTVPLALYALQHRYLVGIGLRRINFPPYPVRLVTIPHLELSALGGLHEDAQPRWDNRAQLIDWLQPVGPANPGWEHYVGLLDELSGHQIAASMELPIDPAVLQSLGNVRATTDRPTPASVAAGSLTRMAEEMRARIVRERIVFQNTPTYSTASSSTIYPTGF